MKFWKWLFVIQGSHGKKKKRERQILKTPSFCPDTNYFRSRELTTVTQAGL